MNEGEIIEKAPLTVISEDGINSEVNPNSEVVDPIGTLIEQLIEKIEASGEGCWRKPASNRKNTMINKLIVLKDLISDISFEAACNKLLHDIKPKLTGDKTKENEESEGNEEFKNPWVTCTELQAEFQLICDEILDYLKNPPALH
jgi:hypothetical protein